MAFSDPQSVTINSVAISMPRTLSATLTQPSVFTSNDGLTKLSAQSTTGKRIRRQIRIDSSKIAADPLISAQNIKYSMSCYLVFDLPPTGYTVAEAKLVSDGFLAALTASSGALVTKLLGGES